MNKPTVSVVEAASILHVHPKTVEDLIHEGAIPAGKVGRAWVMMTRDVLAHAEKTILEQTAARMGAPEKRARKSRRIAKLDVTTSARRGQSREGSHTASSSRAPCGR